MKSVNLSLIERRRAILLRQLATVKGRPVDAERLTLLLLPALTHPAYDPVFESVRYLAGRLLTDSEIEQLAWLLAGNLPSLKAGNPVHAWTCQTAEEWVPLQVLRVLDTRDQYQRYCHEVRLRVLAGTPAGRSVTVRWSTRNVQYVAGQIGFSAPFREYPYSTAAEIVGLRLYGKLEPARSKTDPGFHEIRCPASMQKRNRDAVLKLRMRIDCNCPQNFTFPCHTCPFGSDRCPAGTHPVTYQVGTCPVCNGDDSLFDPDTNNTACVKCTTKDRLRKK